MLKYHVILDKDYWNLEKRKKLDNIQQLIQQQITDILIVNNPNDADLFIVWWWDWFMIKMLKKYKLYNKPFFWINAGTVWFLLNHMKTPNLPSSLDELDIIDIPLIKTKSITESGEEFEKIFVNDVLLWESWSWFHDFQFTSKTTWNLVNILCSELLINTPIWSSGQAVNGRLPLMDLRSDLLGITTAWAVWLDRCYIVPEEMTIKDVRWRDNRHAKHDWSHPDNKVDNIKQITIYPPEEYVQISYKKDEKYHDKRLLLAQKSLWNVILWKNWTILN